VGSASARHRYAQFVVVFAAFVVFAGAMVTSTGSGMAVPDWPQSFGTWTPRMQGGVFFEHGHRMVAGSLAVLVTVLAFWSWITEPRGWVRAISWAAFITVLIQAALGGLTVLLGTFHDWDHTDPLMSTLHASTAQALFALLVTYAVVTAPGWLSQSPRRPVSLALAGKAAWLPILVYAQILVGAAMRHQHAGLIIYDFPLSYGRIIPPFYSPLVALNFAHRVGGWAVFAASWALGLTVLRDPEQDPWVRWPAKLLLAAVSAQFLLGASAVWTKLTLPALTSAHVLGGSVVFTTSLVLALRLRRLAAGSPS
jgi:cytochrome c oxidase assembly protein subunit 15